MKIFSAVTLTSMRLSLTVTTLSLIGIAITGFYPGIVVFLFLTLIPLASRFYAKTVISKSTASQRRYYTTLTLINLLTILVVLWMTFVIVIDRVVPSFCESC